MNAKRWIRCLVAGAAAVLLAASAADAKPPPGDPGRNGHGSVYSINDPVARLPSATTSVVTSLDNVGVRKVIEVVQQQVLVIKTLGKATGEKLVIEAKVHAAKAEPSPMPAPK